MTKSSCKAADLGSEELGGRILICIVGRYVDETVNIVLRNSFCYALSTLNVDILEIEIPKSFQPMRDPTMKHRYFVG